MVAQNNGVCLVTPKGNDLLNSLFTHLGGCVECKTEVDMNAMMVTTGLMGPIYGLMRSNIDWLVQQNIPPEDASFFVTRQFLNIVQDAERLGKDPTRVQTLIDEQTPGGLNEQARKNLEKLGFYKDLSKAMDAMYLRIRGESDGSIE